MLMVKGLSRIPSMKAELTMRKFVLKSSLSTLDALYETREQAEQALEKLALDLSKKPEENTEENTDDWLDLSWEYDAVKAHYSVAEVETDFFVFEFYYNKNGELVQNKLAEFDTEEEAKNYSEPLDTPTRRVFYVEGIKK